MPVSRATVPSEFFDITSAMMLRQPEPEYPFAKLAFAAQARAELMATDAAAVLAATGRGPDTQGAPYADLAANQLALSAHPLAEAVVAVNELGQKGIGHTIRLNRPVFSGGGYTEAARTISSAQSISTTPIEVSAEQVSVSVKRFVGPYASGGSQPQPYAIDRLDAQRSVHSLAGVVGLHLSRDRMKWLDTVFSLAFDAGANVVRPGNITADGSLPASGEAGLDLDSLFRAEETLRTNNIPAFADGSYLTVVSPKQMRQLKLDPDFMRLAVFDSSRNPLGIPSIVRVGRLSLVESNTIQTDTATISGQTIQRGCMFGPGAVGYGVADACRVASAAEDNYGEQVKVVWMAYEGFAVLDNRFIVSLRSI